MLRFRSRWSRLLPRCGLLLLLTIPLQSRASLAEVDGHGGAASGVIVETLARSQKAWDGSPLPLLRGANAEVRVLRITIPAGVRLHRHLHPVFNAGVLLQGHLRVYTDSGHTLDLLPGQAIVESVNQVHYGESLGPDPAVIVVVYVGPAGVAITTPVAGAAPRTQSRPVPASP